jgi:DMSO/TMAO reductase YedYZ molybdopterin-dependent catalytic subunit
MHHRLYGSRWHGVAIGLLATFAGLAVAELVVGFVRGAASPVLPVGQEVIDVVPRSVKNWAIDTFGTADKAVLILGTLLSLAVIGSIVGLLAVRGARTAAAAVTGVVGLIGVWAVTMRPDPTFGKLLPPVVGTVVSIAALWWMAPATVEPAIDEGGPSGAVEGGGVARRGFLQSAGTVGILALSAGAVGQLLKRRFEIDDERATLAIPEAEGTLAEVAPVTVSGDDPAIDPQQASGSDFGYRDAERWQVPNDDFYRIDTALAVPQVSRESWNMRIHGMVDRELRLTFADVLARPMIERYVTLSCVSNEIGGGLVGNALFQGVRLKDLLDEAGVQQGATQVVSRSIDGWDCGSPTSAIMDGRDAMLAIAMNGEPLPAEHGYPARLVVPGLYGYVSATKWVTEIELTRWEDFDGYWVPRGWAKDAPVKTMARIDRPRRGRSYSANAGGSVDIAGLAWAVHRGISRVEVSIDDGAWLECELAGIPSDDTWCQWRYRWAEATAGEHTVRARAYDGEGIPQPEGPKGVAPDGAEGYHRVRFAVE